MSDVPVDIVDRFKPVEATPVYASHFEAQLHRCDRCKAQAPHTLSKGELELLLCNHHFDEHAEKLQAEGWSVSSGPT